MMYVMMRLVKKNILLSISSAQTPVPQRGLSRFFVWCIYIMFLLYCTSEAMSAQQLRIAAASDLQWAMNDLATAFRAAHPNASIDAVYGSSGNFTAQIRAGAPFDAFFSADTDYPQMLENAGLTVGARREYARGQIVLWAVREDILNILKKVLGKQDIQSPSTLPSVTIVKFLTQPEIKRIAIANPAHAPYGKRAKEFCAALTKDVSVEKKLETKFVLADNVAQAAQLVGTGAADCGIVSLSLVLAPVYAGKGVWTLLDSTRYSPLRQAAVVIKSRPNVALAEEFVRFVCSAEGARILARYGFRSFQSETLNKN